MPSMATESLTYGLQAAPQLNYSNMQQLQGLLGMALPGYQGMVGKMAGGVSDLLGGPITQQLLGPSTQSLLAGQIPADVQNQITRGAAQQAITSGMGAGGGPATAAMGRTITARDLGLTSLDLMKTGVSLEQAGTARETAGLGAGGNLLQLARNYLMPQPVNPMSLLPFQDLVAGQQWMDTAQFEANLAGYTAASNQAAAAAGQVPNQSVFGALSGIGGTIKGLAQPNPQTGQSGFNLISQLFGGGGGAGGANIAGLGGGFGQSGGVGFSGTGDIFNVGSLASV